MIGFVHVRGCGLDPRHRGPCRLDIPHNVKVPRPDGGPTEAGNDQMGTQSANHDGNSLPRGGRDSVLIVPGSWSVNDALDMCLQVDGQLEMTESGLAIRVRVSP